MTPLVEVALVLSVASMALSITTAVVNLATLRLVLRQNRQALELLDRFTKPPTNR